MTRPSQNPDRQPGGDRAVLIESGPAAGGRTGTQKYVGVRTNRYTWLAWDWHALPSNRHGPPELYDRSTDAGQVHNLAAARTPAPPGPALHALAAELRACKGAACVRSAP